MWLIGYTLRQNNRLRLLPALARDLCASVFVLATFAAAATLPSLTIPAAALVLVPVLLLAALVFGRDSALLAALLAALMARIPFAGPTAGSGGLLAIVALSAVALAVAALVEELQRSRAEAEAANLCSDATARRAAERVEAARRQLRMAEDRLAEAERKARQAGRGPRSAAAARTGGPDPALESAFRSEGGV